MPESSPAATITAFIDYSRETAREGRHLVERAVDSFGFMMSLVVAGAAFEGGVLENAKISILLAFAISAIVGLLMLSHATFARTKGVNEPAHA